MNNRRQDRGKSVLKIPVPEPIYVDLTENDNAFSITWGSDGWEVDALEDGTPYPHPPIHVLPAMSYCNFLICNHVVLASKYYQEGMPDTVMKKDDLALEVLQNAFPNHRIIQINPLALNLYGGIHCHTRNIPKR